MSSFFYFKNLQSYKEVCHGVTKRIRKAPYDFSLALHTGENPDIILLNRAKVSSKLACKEPWKFVLADQTHGDHIAIVRNKESLGWNERQSAIKNSDALVTDQRGVMLGILSADCVPILLYDPVCKVVAAIHAGWRGSAQGIAAKSVAAMCNYFGTNPADILVGIAPSIGGCCYEVDKDVAQAFREYTEAIMVSGNKIMLNLSEVNRLQLINSGIKEEKIELSGICTACHKEEFFSYRQSNGCSGRFMSMIGLRHN